MKRIKGGRRKGKGGARSQACSGAPSSLAFRDALTLIELLLVLALLSIIAGLATPSIGRSFASVKLRRAGDEVLAAWTEARTEAIRSGEVQQFLFQVEGSTYRVAKWSTTEETEPEEPAAEQAAESETGLNKEIVFHAGSIIEEQITGDTSRQRQVVSLKGRGKETWSQPLLFFPNGSTSDATVALKNASNQYLRIRLRGLTGVGRKSNVMSQSEWDEAQER
ncbi:prepilin-type N-terminal cleavage/methylation domain-containing protein [Adhaeretor mobilis]|uniref:Prepilin-type N-terminal cleavage/methylation domain-containing protein n=1 Tax=Adhaeretor mobilis TaxID=1930276 RepID=A0A517MUN1_9BACT|nr:prepilin-type N-terminal cleavage/methylation domain-containing protein [Adhaeretor mobilis]QDS98594.1 hypothetical protein HG15A2_18750 [Adhaeretor mobilis]